MSKTIDYSDKAEEQAADAVRELVDDVTSQLVENGRALGDISASPYGRNGDEIESSWSDDEYTPQEAITCLDHLDDYEETDEGLWEGLDWKRMLSAKAAFTFRNACFKFFDDLIEKINENVDMDDIRGKLKDFQRADSDSQFDEWLETKEGKKALNCLVEAEVKRIADEYHK